MDLEKLRRLPEHERQAAIDAAQRQVAADARDTLRAIFTDMAEAFGAEFMFDACLETVAPYAADALGGQEVAAHLRATAGRVERIPKRAK